MMTPDFALNLTETGISLLHRTPTADAWVQVDEVRLDGGDLATGLHRLRDAAKTLAGGDFSTKLILPQSQLLYATVSVSGDEDSDIRAALEGQTPYHADQLVYASSGTGDTRQIVAVARDTLREAEDFIAPYGFNAVGFTSIPATGHFDGEPHLGKTSSAADDFRPDTQPVRIVSTAGLATSAPASDPAPDADKPAAFTSRRRPASEKSASETPVSEPSDKAPGDRPVPALNASKDTSQTGAVPKLGPAQRKDTKARTPRTAKTKPSIDAGAAAQSSAVQARPKTKKKTGKPKREPAVAAMVAKVEDAPARAKKPLTVADPLQALANQKAAQQRSNRVGVILTLILVAVLGAFAVLSSYLLPEDVLTGLWGDSDQPEETREINETELSALVPNNLAPDRLAADDLAPAVYSPDTEFLVNFEEPASPSFGLPRNELPPVTGSAVDQEPALDLPGPLDENEAAQAYLSSRIWQRAPDLRLAAQRDALDDLYIASLDPDPAFEDAPALPVTALTSGDAQLGDQPLPPPAGMRFDLNEKWMVRATPQGALNPEGIPIYLGKPPVTPLRRPGAETSDDTPAITPEAAAPVALTAEQNAQQIRLAAYRPLPRPGNLIETRERAVFGGRSRSELAALRPGQRPVVPASARAAIDAAVAEAVTQTPRSAAAQSGGASLAATQTSRNAVDPASVDSAILLASASPLAVAASLQPTGRPRAIAQIASRARQAKRARTVTPLAQPDIQAASAATASPSRGSGPAVARASRAKPTGRTAASVARAATDRNALALGQVALIGVFGTSSKRRALVRMPNGRFRKVTVGDRVDGGRVAAIGASQLRYTKGGRTVTLRMPQG